MTTPRRPHRNPLRRSRGESSAQPASDQSQESTTPATGTDHSPSPDEPAAGDAVGAPAVLATFAAWRRRLGELAGESALGNIFSLGDALVDLTAAHPSGIAQLYAGRPTKLSNLAREGSALTHARRRARIVLARTDELAQRYGFAPTYVAIGVATWERPEPESESESDAESRAVDQTHVPADQAHVPALLRPVRITVDGDGEIEFTLDPAVEINPVLVRAFRSAGLEVDPEEVVAATRQAHGFTPAPALERLEGVGEDLPSFVIEPRVVLGAFVHPGQALADDLDDDRSADHEVVAALAGDSSALRARARPLPATEQADRDPEAEHGVGDLDAAQHRVLDAVREGAHLLLDVPPGVDVAATVAAVVADAVSAGKRVLYVPGTKRAAQSLRAHLAAHGLDGLLLDLAGDPEWRSGAATRLVDGLDPHPEPVDADALRADRRELVEARTALADYVFALHTRRDPWEASAYRAMQELARLTSQRPGPRTQVQLTGAAMTMSERDRQRAREDLALAAGLGAFRMRASDTPWYGAALTGAEHALASFERVRRLSGHMPTLREQIASTAAQTGLDEAATLREWSQQLDLLDGIRSSLDVFTSSVFERSPTAMVAATASSAWRAENEQQMGMLVRRRLKKQAKDLLRPGVTVPDLHAELVLVAQRRELWRRHCAGGGWPRLPEGLTAILATEHDIAGDVASLQEVLAPTFEGSDLRDVPIATLATKLERLADDDATVRQLPERAGVLGGLRRMGLSDLVEDLTVRRVDTALVGAEFDLAWWSSLLERILREDPALAGIDGRSLEHAAQRLRELDERHTRSLGPQVAARAAERVRDAIAADKPAAQQFYLAVRSGETDLKELQRRFGRITWAARPVWVVPPMVVPQVLEPERDVDLVILDAIQHLPTEQAVAAISRGRQVVIVGDSRRGGGSGLVAHAQELPRLELPGDRLDLDADIASFLVQHGYQDVISPVPTPPGLSQIAFDLVHGTGMPGPGKEAVESVQAEVDRVVDLVIEHALTKPDSSLAVIALNAHHADRVREAVLSTAAGASVAAFFDGDRPEPFTVVDIESVAGLRRDSVILTVGYGKTPHGRVLHRFGVIGSEHGDQLVVDALDACRHRLTVVSCVEPDDLDPERLRTPGARMLRDLLIFARDGLDGAEADGEPIPDPDRLLLDLADRLRRLGLTVVARYGRAGGVRIPLAVGPSASDLVLALLTDDPDYVSQASLRRRDRHWAQRLESRGWRVRTLFSAGVFMDPQGEAERIRDQVAQIVADRAGSSDAEVALAPPPVEDEVEDDIPEALTGAESASVEDPERGDDPDESAPSAAEPTDGPNRGPTTSRDDGPRGDDDPDAAPEPDGPGPGTRPEPPVADGEDAIGGEDGEDGEDRVTASSQSSAPKDRAEPGDPSGGDTSADVDRREPPAGRGPSEEFDLDQPTAPQTRRAARRAAERAERERRRADPGVEEADPEPEVSLVIGSASHASATRSTRLPRRATRPGREQGGDTRLAWEDNEHAWGDVADDSDRLQREKPPHWS